MQETVCKVTAIFKNRKGVPGKTVELALHRLTVADGAFRQ